MRSALVVGLGDYPDAPLPGAVIDACGMAKLLETHERGTQNFDVELKNSSSTIVDSASLQNDIRVLFGARCDLALFYYSGHCVIKDDWGVLITPGLYEEGHGVPLDWVLKAANESSARNRVIILDCCHAGALGAPALFGGRVAQLSEGLTILTASRASEEALEVNGRGVFTSLVLEALKGGAADLRGHVTPGGVYAYVDQALGARGQRPTFRTNVTDFVTLRDVRPPIPFRTLVKIALHFRHAEAVHRLSPDYEYTSHDPCPAKVAIFKDLQRMCRVGLVVPVGEEHMYYAAMNSGSCRLTALGRHYWRLADEKKL